MGAPYIYDISRLRVKDLHSATYIYVVRRLRVNYFPTLRQDVFKIETFKYNGPGHFDPEDTLSCEELIVGTSAALLQFLPEVNRDLK